MSGRGAIVALGALLAGCAAPPTQGTVTRGTVARVTVAQVAVALTAADQVALQYVQLPPCPAPVAGGMCRDPATVARIRAAAGSAYAAVRRAEASGAAGDLSLAESAVGVLGAALPAVR